MEEKKLGGASLAGGSVSCERIEHDYYATNPQSVRDFLDVHPVEGSSFYEPCCGEGHISKVLKEYFPDALHLSTDIIDRDYGDGAEDFLRDDYEPRLLEFFQEGGAVEDKFDWIITNPPFKEAQKFIQKSLELTNVGVAMFLKIQFLEGQSRKEWLKNSPLKYVYVFSSRQFTMRNGEELDPKTGKKWANTMCFAWFVWEHGYNGEPMVRWI